MAHETSAVILASGAGTRLGDITANTPKPLLKFGSKPYLGHLIGWLIRSGVDDITVTTYTHGGQIEKYIGTVFPGRVTAVREPSLVSTVQSAQYGLEQARHEQSLLLTADNIWGVPLGDFINEHHTGGAKATVLATANPAVPNAGQVVVAPEEDTILQMWPGVDGRAVLPPPVRPASTMGLYAVSRTALLGAIHEGDTSIEREPMDRLAPDLQAYWYEGFFYDYGTEANYQNLLQHPELITQHQQ